LTLLVECLDAQEAEIREAALRAISFYGPDAKPAALAKLLEKVVDPDPAVASLVLRVIESFAPFEGNDRQVLIDNLSHSERSLRLLSSLMLAGQAPNEATALAWFRPRLTDTDPQIRELAITAIAKWGVPAKAAVADLMSRLEDESLPVQVAAVRGLGELGGGPGVVAALTKLIDPKADPKPDPRLRSAALRAILKAEFIAPASEVAVLGFLLEEPDPLLKTATLLKLSTFGAAAEPFLPQIVESLKHPELSVRIAALKAIAAIGPKASKYAPQVAELVTKKFDSDGVAKPLAGNDSEEVAARILRSAAWVSVNRFGREASIGSGVLVDRRARLIMTNYHVVDKGHSFTVYFPYRHDGQLETNADYYQKNFVTVPSRTSWPPAKRIRHKSWPSTRLYGWDRVPRGNLQSSSTRRSSARSARWYANSWDA
jgi:HEAT repeat protein